MAFFLLLLFPYPLLHPLIKTKFLSSSSLQERGGIKINSTEIYKKGVIRARERANEVYLSGNLEMYFFKKNQISYLRKEKKNFV